MRDCRLFTVLAFRQFFQDDIVVRINTSFVQRLRDLSHYVQLDVLTNHATPSRGHCNTQTESELSQFLIGEFH